MEDESVMNNTLGSHHQLPREERNKIYFHFLKETERRNLSFREGFSLSLFLADDGRGFHDIN